jgi:DNA helicase II / ATP-dependent DNA helicase PcrA
MIDPDEISPHEETREFRYFGPPGTGKTTTLGRQVHRAVDRYGPNGILVTSFSKASAAELLGRDLPVHKNRIGTLHSHCWRAVGGPKIAEEKVEEWNKQHPTLALSSGGGRGSHIDGDIGPMERKGQHPGDKLLEKVNVYRGRLIDQADWTTSARDFYDRWTKWKTECNFFDFTDLIEIAYRNFSRAPDAPSVIFADEAQDLNPLQLALIRQWGRHTEYFILAGDDDQTLYGWCGCEPQAMLSPALPPASIRVLSQSYRLPRQVHRTASAWVERIKQRQPKEYLPRDAEGEVKTLGYDYTMGAAIVRVVESHLKRGETVMLLASCGYQLWAMRDALREAGIPFHNPYRETNYYWNPLRDSAGSAVARVLALLAAHPKYEDRYWQRGELRLFAEWIGADYLKRGVKTRLMKLPEAERAVAVDGRELVETFAPFMLDKLMHALDQEPAELTRWWLMAMGAAYSKRATYPARIAERLGRQALEDPPKVILGTIHSVKGGEADVVMLFPDVSPQGFEQMWDQEGMDAARRLFYVGMTRARNTLYLAVPRCYGNAVGWNA